MTRRDLARRIALDGALLPSPWHWKTLAFAALYPARGARYYRSVFRRWACLPGDVFEDFQRDQTVVVKAVKVRHVDVYVFANQLLARPDLLARGRAVVDVERVERGDRLWVDANPDRARLARVYVP